MAGSSAVWASACVAALTFLVGAEGRSEGPSPNSPYRSLALPESSARLRLAAATIELGSTPAELSEIAAECNRAAGAQVCHPESFALEIHRERRRAVPSFFLDRYEVALSAYNRCVRAGRCAATSTLPRGNPGTSFLELPVVGVTQSEASDYCSFVGARLPREEEFERAARGTRGRRFPWGDLFHAGRVNGGSWGTARTNGDDGYEELAPSRAFSDGRTPEGILQLVGNAEEWTLSSGSSDSAPQGFAAVRGGHFAAAPEALRGATRAFVVQTARSPSRGFRCARSDPRVPGPSP